MRIAINIAVCNEQQSIQSLLDALASQTRKPDEIIIVDDGSTDKTAEKIKSCAQKNNLIRYIYQHNAGPAAARNNAWKNSCAEICIFTDGDCVPKKDWIEQSVAGFTTSHIGATAGTYETLNNHSILARFIGYEIAWKYSRIGKFVDFHGTYNLAVRRNVLEEIDGFDEKFKTAEDADLTYKISKKYRILFNPNSIVGHYHPDKFWLYMKNQTQRGRDRLFLYRNHPDRISQDVYTGKIIKYQVLATGLFLPASLLFFPFFKFSFILPTIILAFLMFSSCLSFSYIAKKDFYCALYGIPLQLSRNFAWLAGLLKGLVDLFLRK